VKLKPTELLPNEVTLIVAVLSRAAEHLGGHATMLEVVVEKAAPLKRSRSKAVQEFLRWCSWTLDYFALDASRHYAREADQCRNLARALADMQKAQSLTKADRKALANCVAGVPPESAKRLPLPKGLLASRWGGPE
jgi:hypothetical protein